MFCSVQNPTATVFCYVISTVYSREDKSHFRVCVRTRDRDLTHGFMTNYVESYKWSDQHQTTDDTINTKPHLHSPRLSIFHKPVRAFLKFAQNYDINPE